MDIETNSNIENMKIDYEVKADKNKKLYLDEDIHIENYNKNWTGYYEKEKEILLNILKDKVISIEHFGSTSIDGLSAKPIIDILVGISFSEFEIEIIANLESARYTYFGEIQNGRIYMTKRGNLNFNLAIVEYKGEIWNNNLKIREYLRKNKVARKEYEQIKYEAVSKGRNKLLEYSKYKNEIISKILEDSKK